MKSLLKLKYEIRTCCQSFLSSLIEDSPQTICEETFHDRSKWLKHRQFRITGARCYGIYTYTKNKKPQWETKALKYFYPKVFKPTKEMKHGIEHESEARKTYCDEKEVEVIQFGLIVPSENSWLGYSPDGVVFNEDGNPVKLIEIKCPFIGKKETASNILTKLSYVRLPEKTLQENHEYYGQVQLGMAILNLKKTDFIIYASFDNSIVVIPVNIDFKFLNMMLPALKLA
ncbi:hypothetical protein ALC62_15722 [Cyphomyrmex costatus]|uniref:YqaJ viral recombinase domain-containing protein n=1 Tax=Cyphomyrmex costatus TaxID=456900 RepID=A0A151I714_9HYME|nr:hypothetical protein ALC62_15722 [Cyphomyrmex costatus]